MLSADTIPGGNVSGTWYQVNSPYYITGDITIPSSDTLTIEPGVEVYFLVWKNIITNGTLEAVGTESDSIYFHAHPGGAWAGLRFVNAQDYSHLDYCSFSDVLGMNINTFIYCTNNSDPVVSHCRIVDDSNYVWHNGDIWVENGSNPSISDCLITGGTMGIEWNSTANGTINGCTMSNFNNEGEKHGIWKRQGNLTMIDCTISDVHTENCCGAGIRSDDGDITLINCTISNNWASGAGGGVYCLHGSHTFINCTFNANTTETSIPPIIGGGGVCLDDANGSFSYCTFYDNFSDPGGGAITINGTGSLTVDHCTIDGNVTWGVGSGMWLRGSPTTNVTNSIISNGNFDYGISNQGALTVEYSDFYGNDLGPIGGNVPAGFGVLDRVNYNADSCDCYYNIFMDPMYVDTLNNDFHLTASSPCIDAGDTAFAYDPDSTITDMGAYWFDQTGIVEYPVVKHINECDFLGATIFKGPLQLPEGNQYKVFDITGRVVMPNKIKPGIYFIEIDGEITQKVVKVR
jgi:parallel beta-helix repeat protein